MKKHTLTLMFVSLISVAGQAQNRDIDVYTDSIVTPQFFIAVIAGVILALGFQFILTALSIALGITAIGDVREKFIKSNYHLGDDDSDESAGMSTGTMITTSFGLWSTITLAISLFGATSLAINLSLITSSVISITLGLVIWATFFILLFYLESRVVSTLVGGLINTATAGLRASGEAVKKMFASSAETQMKNVAQDTIESIRKDFKKDFSPGIIKSSLDEFFSKIEKKMPDYSKVKNDIQEIVDNSAEDGDSNSGVGKQAKWMAIQQ
ncbi:MAG: hypothetical protein V7767_07575, partial [Leeuwenhoekiella sp.]